jgi:hypothetical protein
MANNRMSNSSDHRNQVAIKGVMVKATKGRAKADTSMATKKVSEEGNHHDANTQRVDSRDWTDGLARLAGGDHKLRGSPPVVTRHELR